MRSPYGPCSQIRWFEALLGDQMAAQGCPFSGTPSLLPGVEGRVFQTARIGQMPWNIARTEPTPLPDSIWMAVPMIFVLMNPPGTSPARDLISQIPIGKVLWNCYPSYLWKPLLCTNRSGMLTQERTHTASSLLNSLL